MTWQSLLIVSSGFLAGTGAGPPEDDLSKIQGTWVLTATERDGDVSTADSLKGRSVKLVFEGNRVLARMDEKSASLGTFALLPDQQPKGYDRTYPDGSPRRGIYKLEGDTLTICIAAVGKDRPKAFTTQTGDGCTRLVYKRETP